MKRPRVQFKHFLDLNRDAVNCDLHMHTTRTDGQADIEAVLREARSRGLTRVAFTEHVRRDTTWFGEFAAAVRSHAEAYADLEALVGCEAKALDEEGALDASQDILAECDIVLGSVHRFPDGAGGFVSSSALAEEELAKREHALASGLVTAAPIDVLAHPGGMFSRRFKKDLPEELMRSLMIQTRDRGIAIEISSSYLIDLSAFLALCREVNPLVSIGSDMHQLKDLGRCRDQLRSCGIGIA